MTTIDVSGRMFLLVPAHPGCLGQSPESRKMVAVVTYFTTVLWLLSNLVLVYIAPVCQTDFRSDISQHVLVGTRVKNWRILLEQDSTAYMPSLTATSALGLRRRK